MSMSSHLQGRAIALLKSGQREDAQAIFETILSKDNCNEAAWVWYIDTMETNGEKIAALETFLNIFPNHKIGKKALQNLRAEETQQYSLPTQAEQEAVEEYKSMDRGTGIKQGIGAHDAADCP